MYYVVMHWHFILYQFNKNQKLTMFVIIPDSDGSLYDSNANGVWNVIMVRLDLSFFEVMGCVSYRITEYSS